MAIEVTCPSCGATLRVEDSTAGKQVRCGRCLSVLRVPEARTDPPPPPPPPAERPLFEEDPFPDDRAPRDEPPRRRPRDYDEEPERRRPRDYDEDEPPRRRRPSDSDYDEDEPRPRRRRRRMPEPPPGRGAGFWVVVILGTLLLGTCACCGGGYLLLPGENWRRHESAAGGFAVEVPGAMKNDLPIPGMKPDPTVKVEGTILWKRGEVYVVCYADLPPPGARGLTDEALLDQAVRDMRTDPEVKRVVREESLTVSGFPAREIEYIYEDNGTYVGRVVVSDRRLYAIIGGGRFVRPNNANVRRFLNSFEVTDKARGNRFGR